MSCSLEGIFFGFLWKIWQKRRFQLRPHHSHLLSSCRGHRELKIHVRSRELLSEKLSLQKLVEEGCLHVADVRLMLCLMMQIILLQQKPQAVNKFLLQFMVVFQKFQLLIQVVSYA